METGVLCNDCCLPGNSTAELDSVSIRGYFYRITVVRREQMDEGGEHFIHEGS